MLGWIVFVTIMAWGAFLPEVRAETALIPIYQDVLRNCKGASQSTRETIIRTALASGRARTLHVSSAIVQEVSDREPDPYPAYVASSVDLCGVMLNDPSRAASLSEKHNIKIVQRGPTTVATGTLRLVASKRYEDFNVRYIVIVPTRAQFDTFRKGERVSFTAEAVGVRQRPEALEVTAILQSLETTPAPHPAETLLIARYQDVLKNCEGASQKTRTIIVASALPGRFRTASPVRRLVFRRLSFWVFFSRTTTAIRLSLLRRWAFVLLMWTMKTWPDLSHPNTSSKRNARIRLR